MVDFIAAVTDAGGNVPMIGDADDGYVYRLAPEQRVNNYASLRNTAARLFGRSDLRATPDDDLKTVWLLAECPAALSPTRRPNLRRGPGRSRTAAISLWPARIPRGARSNAWSMPGRSATSASPRTAMPTLFRSYCHMTAANSSSIRELTLITPSPSGALISAAPRRITPSAVDGQDQSLSGGNFMWLRHARLSRAAMDQRCNGRHAERQP